MSSWRRAARAGSPPRSSRRWPRATGRSIYIIGTLDLEAAAELPSRPDFIRDERARHPDLTVAETLARYERLQAAQAARETLAELRRLAGEGRVRYLRADVRDAESLRAAVEAALGEAGRLDLVLHAAGINRSSLIPGKRFEDYRAVRDIKVLGHRNLRSALAGRMPAMWCNFSSLAGVTGQVGEVDYAAGNDYLACASQFATRVLGEDEFAIGWSLWTSVGLGANPVTAAFLERGGVYTGMDTSEGIHHFLRELHLPLHAPSIVFMGEAEKTALLDYRPGAMLPEAPKREEGGFFLDREVMRSRDAVEFERVFHLERDAYLAEHVVDGHPTLPGTFVTEIAAEAAMTLAPGRVAICFEDAVFSSFLRVYGPDRPAAKRIHATVQMHDDLETVVRVRISTDVVTPGGVVVATDRTHFEVTVRLRDEMPAAPRWEHWSPDEDGPLVRDPYHVPNPAVLLTGSFVSTRDTRLHALGRRAEFDLHVDAGDRRFGRFAGPGDRARRTRPDLGPRPCRRRVPDARGSGLHAADRSLRHAQRPRAGRRLPDAVAVLGAAEDRPRGSREHEPLRRRDAGRGHRRADPRHDDGDPRLRTSGQRRLPHAGRDAGPPRLERTTARPLAAVQER